MLAAADRLACNLAAAETATLEEALRTAREVSGGAVLTGDSCCHGAFLLPAEPEPADGPGHNQRAVQALPERLVYGATGAGGGMNVRRLPNEAPESRYLVGTSKMIDRPVVDLIVY